MTLTKEQLCKALAEDYADRANRGGLPYEAAYDRYIERCKQRSLEDLKHQYKVAGLK